MYMTLNDLTELDIYRAIFTSIFVIISLIVGIKIILKYFKLKNKELITIGMAWILMSSSYYSLTISFVTIILFNYSLEPILYIFFFQAFLIPGLICWIYSFANLSYPQYKKNIYYPYLIFCVVYEILFLILLFVDFNLIAVYEGGFIYRRTMFSILFLIVGILTVLISGILFGVKSLKSEDIRIKWKGRFFMIAIFSYVIGGALDVFSAGNLILQIVNRLILISSAIEYYFGFFFPEWLANILIKNQE